MQRKTIVLLILLAGIAGSIWYLESQKASTGGADKDSSIHSEITNEVMNAEKADRFELAKEISSPDAFINTEPITIKELIGKKVILVDFWTYSCINCQRTLPYLNAWHETYNDEGLVILGVHTPEFEFEKKLENVQAAVDQFGIEYPVILDNDFSTWRAYKNRYWPRKYLIDIDGYIVYDHIGEGGYDETEREIRRLLEERKERLDDSIAISSGSSAPAETDNRKSPKSPETYFGSLRNELLVNGTPNKTGVQSLTISNDDKLQNSLYLDGEWRIEPEYASNNSVGRIGFKYTASNVFMVASGTDGSVVAEVYIDGKRIGAINGSDVSQEGTILFNEERLYHIISDDSGPAEHYLELRLTEPGLRAYTFTFG